MRPCADSLSLTPYERCREVARVLAAGLRRLHSLTVIAAETGQDPKAKIPANPSPDCLELPAQPRLSVHGG
jgi:hypothetical protein